MNKKKARFLVVGIVALGFIGYFVQDYVRFLTTDNAQVQAHSLMIASKVSGFVEDVKVNEGDKVKKDQILVRIDSRDFKNTVNQVEGEIGSVVSRKVDLEKNESRFRELYSKGAVSQAQYDTAHSAAADIRNKVQALSAQVAQAKLNLENTEIRAPSDGFIAKRSVEVGQLASSGLPLIGFVAADERWVVANFKETEISEIHQGSKVRMWVDAIESREFSGVVDSISSATGSTFSLLPPDNATGNFTKVVQRVPVKIRLDGITEADIENLRSGLSVIVKVRK